MDSFRTRREEFEFLIVREQVLKED